MKSYHRNDKRTAASKLGLMNPPHTAGLDNELQMDGSTYIHARLGRPLVRRGRCETETCVSNTGRKRRAHSAFHGVVTPTSQIELNV